MLISQTSFIVVAALFSCVHSAAKNDVDEAARLRTSNIAENALKDLQGDWIVVKCDRNGMPNPGEIGGRITFDGNTAIVYTPDGIRTKYRISLHPEQSPKAIDWMIVQDGQRQVLHGIYTLEGDTLRNCSPAAFGALRPTELATKSGDGRWVFELKRRNCSRKHPRLAPSAQGRIPISKLDTALGITVRRCRSRFHRRLPAEQKSCRRRCGLSARHR